MALLNGVAANEMLNWRMDLAKMHFHDLSTGEVAWNDVQAIQAYKLLSRISTSTPYFLTLPHSLLHIKSPPRFLSHGDHPQSSSPVMANICPPVLYHF